jgi:hypothetical protein
MLTLQREKIYKVFKARASGRECKDIELDLFESLQVQRALSKLQEMIDLGEPAPYGQGDEEDMECEALERIIRHSGVPTRPKKAL